MKKPSKKTFHFYDYQECSEHIERVLGIEDLRDVEGKYRRNPDGSFTQDGQRAYKDFWHFLCDCLPINNGTVIQIWSDIANGADDWQKQIVDAFVAEFGDGADYLVHW